MNILWMILLGLIAGAIAKLIMPGKDPGGIFVTILLGIAGSLLGGIGVSGAPGGDNDDTCAAAGIKAISDELELG